MYADTWGHVVTVWPCWMQFINGPLGGAGLTWPEGGMRIQYHAGNPALLSFLHCVVKTKHQLITWEEENVRGRT